MPDATITSSESTFGTISGTFAADQSTIAGTITAITGTVNGSVGVPGPQGPQGVQGIQGVQGVPGAPGQGVAAGGSAGQVLQKLSSTSYDTGWLTLPADYITSVTAPLAVASGNLSVNLSAYLPLAGGTITGDILSYNGSRFQTIASGSGSTYSQVTPDGVVVSGGGVGGNQISIQWDGITFADGKQTVKYPGASILTGYATESWVTAGFYPLTGNPSGFLTSASLSGYATESWVTSQGYITSAALTPYITSATATASFYPLSGNPSGFLTSAPVTSVAGRTGAITLSNTDISGLGSLAVVNDAPSDGSQYARKNAAWDVVISGDRYLTTSTTSNTVSNGNKTFTIGTGLSYTPTQNITISYDASNHMHGEVLTYNSGTGVLTVDINHHTGSGTYAAWVVNVGGVTPATSVAWGAITGTLSTQTDLQNALNLKLAATTAASTYQTLSGMSSYLTTFDASTTYYLQTNPSGFISDAPSDGSTYGRNNGAWTVTGGSPYITSVSAPFTVTSGDLSIDLSPYETISNAAATYQTLAGMSSYLTTADAATTYYPLSGNPSAFLVAADITGKANSADSALTGNVTITTNSATAALTITQDGAGDILRLNDVAGDTTFTFVDALGKVNTVAATTASAGLNVAHGVAPTSPVNGDIWTTTAGLFARINAGTRQFATLSDGQSFSGNNTFTGPTLTFGNTTAASTVNIATGATLTATTKAVNIGTAGASGSTTNVIIGSSVAGAGCNVTVNGVFTTTGGTQTINNNTAATTTNIATGATTTGLAKAINIGTNGAAGSTTTISLGSTTGTSSILLNGSTSIALGGNATATTPAADTNSTALATTAFVVGQAGSATPLVNGTAAVGTSLRYARQDHVHPTDNSRAALASPTFTGTPLSTTAAVDTNTTQIATTAYVVAQAAAATPLVDGTAAVGTSLRYARADHVHPTDTSRAALNSPTFTGTPTLPTGTIATTQSPGNNTTAVATTAFVTAAVPAFSTNAQTIVGTSTTTALSPSLIPAAVTRPELRSLAHIFYTAISGSGTVTSGAVNFGQREMYLGSLATGRANFTYGLPGVNSVNMSRSSNNQIDFSKKIWLSGKCMCGGTVGGTNYNGDSNTYTRVTLGGYGSQTTGDMTSKGIGWRKQGGTSSFFNLTVHNGTTLTNVASSITQSDGRTIDWQIYSDGAGNVTLYIDGAEVATTSSGPIGLGTANASSYREQVEAATAPTVRGIIEATGGWLYIEG